MEGDDQRGRSLAHQMADNERDAREMSSDAATSLDMDRIRALINEIIEALKLRSLTDASLSRSQIAACSTHLDDKRKAPKFLEPNNTGTYDYLFGFGTNARVRLPRSDDRGIALRPVKHLHIIRIDATLRFLEIYKTARKFDKSTDTWIPFLEFALAKIEGRTPPRSGDPARTPKPPVVEPPQDQPTANDAGKSPEAASTDADNEISEKERIVAAAAKPQSETAEESPQDAIKKRYPYKEAVASEFATPRPNPTDASTSDTTDVSVNAASATSIPENIKPDVQPDILPGQPAELMQAHRPAPNVVSDAPLARLLSSTMRRAVALVSAVLFLAIAAFFTRGSAPHRVERPKASQAVALNADAPNPEASSPHSTPQQDQRVIGPSGVAGLLAPDPGLLIGPNAGVSESYLAGVLNVTVDPRLEKAKELRAEGKIAEADKLVMAVKDEWSRLDALGAHNKAEGDRQLAASAFSERQFDTAIARYIEAANIDPTATDYNEIGFAYYSKHDLGKALEGYNKAIEMSHGTFAWAYNNKGNVFLEQVPPDADKAIDSYNAAIEADPKLASAFSNLGNALKSKEQYDDAIKNYEKALEINPDLAEAYNGRGTVYHELKKFDEAIKDYSDAIRLKPDFIQAIINRGFSYFLMSDFSDAVDDFTRAIDLIRKTPDFDKMLAARAYTGRGSSYNITVRFDDAIADFNQAINLDPANSFPYAGRASALGSLRRYDEAFENYRTSLAHDRSFAPTYLLRGSLYMSLSKWDLAAQDFEKVIKFAPNEPWGFLGRGVSRVMQHDEPGAMKDWDDAENVSRNPAIAAYVKIFKYALQNDVEHAIQAIEPLFAEYKTNSQALSSVYFMRARLFSAQGEYEKSIADYTSALVIDPDNLMLLSERGGLYAKNGSPSKAIADYDKITRLDPENVAAYLDRGNVYQNEGDSSGDYTKALDDYNKAIGLDPKPADLAVAYLNLGAIHVNTGEQDLAIADYEKAGRSGVVPYGAKAYVLQAFLFESRGDYAHAVASYDDALKIVPDAVGVYDRRAQAYRATENFGKSEASYSDLIAKDPRDVGAHVGLGDTYFAAKEYDKAIKEYTMAIDLRPSTSYGYYERGRALEAKGLLDRAIDDYESARRLNPNNLSVLRKYLVRSQRDATTATKELSEDVTKLDQKSPLYSLVQLFIGLRSAEEVLANAGDYRCEISFYVGSWYRLRQNEGDAIQVFNEGLKACTKADISYYDVLLALNKPQH